MELRDNGFYGHKLILGATPNKGTRIVRLEDQYRIPVGVIEYVCGWNLSKDDLRSPENLVSQIRLDDPQNHFIQPEDLRNCRHYFNGGEIVPHYGIPFRIKPPPWFPPPPKDLSSLHRPSGLWPWPRCVARSLLRQPWPLQGQQPAG